jgi:metal-responsive CopG/Arc/MetJ family transcriptional regulator
MGTRQPTKPRRTKTITIEIPPELLAVIDERAEAEMTTRSGLCRQLLAKAIRQAG